MKDVNQKPKRRRRAFESFGDVVHADLTPGEIQMREFVLNVTAGKPPSESELRHFAGVFWRIFQGTDAATALGLNAQKGRKEESWSAIERKAAPVARLVCELMDSGSSYEAALVEARRRTKKSINTIKKYYSLGRGLVRAVQSIRHNPEPGALARQLAESARGKE